MSQSETPENTGTRSKKSGGRYYAEVTADVHRILDKAAKQTKLTKAAYASAAISYFAERGLNPEADRQREGMVIQSKIADNQAKTEQMITSLGNRLFGWLTQHEKNLNADLFGFLRGHEKTLFDYLQAQDKNVHEHLADQEEMFLLPLMREVMLTNVEALYARRLGEQLMLKAMLRDQLSPEKMKEFNSEYASKHRLFNEKRDEDAKKKLDGFVEKLMLAPQPLATQLQPTPIPQRPKKAADSAAPADATEPIQQF